MIKDFNQFDKKDQELLFWNICVLIVLLIGVTFFIPYQIVSSKKFIEAGLTSTATITRKWKDIEHGTFEYDIKYLVDNGDTLNSHLSIGEDLAKEKPIKIYYSDRDNFYVEEYNKVHVYKTHVFILAITWTLIFTLILITILRPRITVKLFKGELIK